MKKIMIDEEMALDISYVISMITKDIKNYPFIEGVLLTTFDVNDEDIISLEFIGSDVVKIDELLKSFADYSDFVNNDLGFKFIMSSNSINNYNRARLNFSQRKAIKNAISSRILFDRNNTIRKQAEYCVDHLNLPPFENLIEYEPAIELLDCPKVLSLNKNKRNI